MNNIDLPVHKRKHKLDKDKQSKLKKLKQNFPLFSFILGLLGFWAAQISILDNLMPLGISYLSFFLYCREKEFVSKKNGFIVLAAVSGGYISQLSGEGLSYLLPIVLIVGGSKYLRRLNPFSYSLGLGILFLVGKTSFAYLDFLPLDLMLTLAEVGVGALLTLLLVRECIPLLEVVEESSAGVKLILLLFVGGGLVVSFWPEIIPGEISFFRLSGAYLILVAALIKGELVGGVVGLLVGSAYNLTHLYTWPLVGGYAVSGLVAGYLNKYGKLSTIFGFLIGLAGYIAFITEVGEIFFLFREGVGAAAVLLITPRGVIENLENLIIDDSRTEELEERRLESFVSRRVSKFSDIFQELSTAFSEVLPDDRRDNFDNLGTFLELITDKVCNDCELVESCWRQSFYSTYKSFFNLLVIAENRGQVTVEDLEKKMEVECSNKMKLARVINQFVKLYELNSYWQTRLRENEEILLKQLTGLSEVVENLAEELTLEAKTEKEIQQKIYNHLRKKGFKVKDVKATNFNEENMELVIQKQSCDRDHECRKQIAPLLEEELEREVSLIWNECGGELEKDSCFCRFAPQSRYQLQTGVATASSEPGVSGDNYTYFKQNSTKFSAIVSDGMGVGSKAARESRSAVKLIKKMIQAGLNYETALQAANSILRLRSREDNFATIDLLQIDQVTGKAEFIKVGSVSSFIKRGTEISMIKSTTWPVGILNKIEIEPNCFQLKEEDLIIMLTDGVLNSKSSVTIKEEWVLKVLRNNLIEDPQSLANYLLEKAQKNKKIRDDMTVLVIRIDKC